MIKAKTESGILISIPKEFHGYKCINTIGYGNTSVVELVVYKKTKQKYSAKIISVSDIKKRGLTRAIDKEMAILDVIDHPHIIKMKEYFEIENNRKELFIVLILEYNEKGDLYSLLFCDKQIKIDQKKKIIFGVLQAIQYLHKHFISHGDIKAENILIKSNYYPKLCDFGFCKTSIVAHDESKFGTLYYAAPELYVTGDFDPFKADIYAIGMTLYLIFELDFPFKEDDKEYIIKKTLNGELNFSQKMDKQLNDLVRRCLSFNPKDRPIIDDILKHDFFSEYNQYYTYKNNNFVQRKFLSDETKTIEENSGYSSSSTIRDSSNSDQHENDYSILTY